MKTLILTLVTLLLSITIVSAQLKIEDPHGYVNHATAGVLIGAGSNIITYQFLIKYTNLSVKQCKVIAFLFGVGSGFLAGHTWESYQMKNGGFYSKNDMLFAGGGSTFSSVGVSFIVGFKGSIPKSRLPIDFEVEPYNPPLVKIK